jgi:hypothetical protein
MSTLVRWLNVRGPTVANLLDEHNEAICEHVSTRLATAFPQLCYDPLRLNAVSFQKQTYRETPRRFHRLIQVVLLFGTLQVVDREYQWGWRVLVRFNVKQYHLLAQVRWYFEEVFAAVPLSGEDKLRVVELRDTILEIVEAATGSTSRLINTTKHSEHNNVHLNGNGNKPHR